MKPNLLPHKCVSVKGSDLESFVFFVNKCGTFCLVILQTVHL